MPKKLHLPKINLSKTLRATFIILVIAAAFSVGYLTGSRGYRGSLASFPKVTISRELPPEKKDLDFALFWKVWDTLHARYFDKSRLVPAQLVYGAIKGMVEAVGDPYTVFLPPDENKVVQQDLQGSFEGVGIQIGFKGSQLAVISPLPSSPAEAAGVEAGDFIVGIRDEKKEIDRGTIGITLPEAVQIIRGPAGTVVVLTVTREGVDEPIEISIVRAPIDVPTIELDYLGEDGSIAHIKLARFAIETKDEWEKVVLDILKKSEVESIVLDLRNNPGGFLQGAVDIASEFLDNGSLVAIEESDGLRSEFRVERIGRLRNAKVVVLVNAGSASASEILAAALRVNKGTILVGKTTFGKGTIQSPEQVDGGAGLHITIAKWLTPEGDWVDKGGLKPDIEMEDNPETEEDEQLQKAIELLSTENM